MIIEPHALLLHVYFQGLQISFWSPTSLICGLSDGFNILRYDIRHHTITCLCARVVCVWALTGNSGLGPTLASGMLPLPMPRASILKVKAATPRPLPAMAAGLLWPCNTESACLTQLHHQTRVHTANERTTAFIPPSQTFCSYTTLPKRQDIWATLT